MDKLKGKWDVVVHTFIGDQFAFHDLAVEGEVLMGTVTDKGNGSVGEILPDGTIKGISKNAMGEFEFIGVSV